jgi:hypothetical protein
MMLVLPLAKLQGGFASTEFGPGITVQNGKLVVKLSVCAKQNLPCVGLPAAVGAAAADFAPPEGAGLFAGGKCGSDSQPRLMAHQMLMQWSDNLKGHSPGKLWQACDLKRSYHWRSAKSASLCPEKGLGRDVVEGMALAMGAIKAHVTKVADGSSSGQPTPKKQKLA